MPLSEKEAKLLVARRAPEWDEHTLRWRWLLDSLEGGQRYRNAVYGRDRHGLPIRNMARHKREYPDPREFGELGQYGGATYMGGTANGMAGNQRAAVGSDQFQFIDDDDYGLRLARTPVPTFVEEVVGFYLSKIYGGEVTRDAPESGPYALLRDWWLDVDGRGSTIDDWMAEVVAPLVLTLGQLDLYFDHPRVPAGEAVETRADVRRLDLGRCVASYILPENMTWWELDQRGRYKECVYLEYAEGMDLVGQGEGRLGIAIVPKNPRYRHWTASETTLYRENGEVVETAENPFGAVPIVRIFDRRKPRCQNVGLSPMEMAAEIQREYYNRDSELILSDTTQAHPLLQGPEDFASGDGSIPIGPAWMLPKKKTVTGGAATYEGFDVIEFPKGGAESLRVNKQDLRDALDRAYCLMKPAGAADSGGGNTVAQSGVSKAYDHDGLHSRLKRSAKTLAKAERAAAELALLVLTDGRPPGEPAFEVSYPSTFSIRSADELAGFVTQYQSAMATAGEAPLNETTLINAMIKAALPGLSDEEYEELSEENRRAIETRARRKDEMAESARPLGQPGGGGDDEDAGDDGEPGDPAAPGDASMAPATTGINDDD